MSEAATPLRNAHDVIVPSALRISSSSAAIVE